ncbi:MAG: hypothetical protein ABS76_01395 [Pelagibacterium sp. SCN 64-44]|nr:MAG: hypothetical protein ABS76_01395 [Pelagibacterium sp. SCN 64-44]
MVRFQTIGAACALALALAAGPVQAQTTIGSYKDSLKPNPSPGEIANNLDSMLGSMVTLLPGLDPSLTSELQTVPPPNPPTNNQSELENILQSVLQELEQAKQAAGSTPKGAESQKAPEEEKFIRAANDAAEKLRMEARAEKEAREAAARTAALAKSAVNRNAEMLANWRRLFTARYPAYAGSPNWASVPAALNAHYVGSSIATMPDGQLSTGSFEVVFDFTTLYAHGGMTFVSSNPDLDGHVSFSGNVLTGSGNALVSDYVSGGAFGGVIIGGEWNGKFYGSAAEMILGDWSALIDSGPNAGMVYGQAGGVR